MTWSYSGNPGSSDRDEVRFLIGDTDSVNQQLSDEELDYLLNGHGSVAGASIAGCDALITKYTRMVTQSTGGISISYSDRVKQYRELRVDILKRFPATPFAGGVSIADNEAEDDDDDRNAAVFQVGFMDNN